MARRLQDLGDDEMVMALDQGFAAGGYRGAMGAGAALLDARSRVTDVPAVFAARWHVRAEDPDGALGWLERALEARDQRSAVHQHGPAVGSVAKRSAVQGVTAPYESRIGLTGCEPIRVRSPMYDAA